MVYPHIHGMRPIMDRYTSSPTATITTPSQRARKFLRPARSTVRPALDMEHSPIARRLAPIRRRQMEIKGVVSCTGLQIKVPGTAMARAGYSIAVPQPTHGQSITPPTPILTRSSRWESLEAPTHRIFRPMYKCDERVLTQGNDAWPHPTPLCL